MIETTSYGKRTMIAQILQIVVGIIGIGLLIDIAAWLFADRTVLFTAAYRLLYRQHLELQYDQLDLRVSENMSSLGDVTFMQLDLEQTAEHRFSDLAQVNTEALQNMPAEAHGDFIRKVVEEARPFPDGYWAEKQRLRNMQDDVSGRFARGSNASVKLRVELDHLRLRIP